MGSVRLGMEFRDGLSLVGFEVLVSLRFYKYSVAFNYFDFLAKSSKDLLNCVVIIEIQVTFFPVKFVRIRNQS